MIAYHGTPSGAVNEGRVRFLSGRHALVSFANPEDVALAADVCQSFALDNGAFTVWKRGGRLDVAGYIRWCEEWHRHPGCDWCLIPDVIDGSEADNDALLADWPASIAGVPVWLNEYAAAMQAEGRKAVQAARKGAP